MYKHKEIEHKNEDMKFSMQVTKKFKDPLTRQANEAVRISNRGKMELLNSKTEFNHPPIARITVERRNFFKKKPIQNVLSKNGLNPKCNPALQSIIEEHSED